MENVQPCWHCKKYAGGCSWNDWDFEKGRQKFEPVKGWVAVPTVKKSKSESPVESFQIMYCPEYDPDGSEKYEQPQGRGMKWDYARFKLLMLSGMTNEEIHRRMGGMPQSTIDVYKRRVWRELEQE